jgi:hypothetical protein
MRYVCKEGQELLVHAHPCDRTCHWSDILKPIAFTVFRDAQLTQVLVRSQARKGHYIDTFGDSYAKWLCRAGENGSLNILNVFFVMLQFRGVPSRPDISPSS